MQLLSDPEAMKPLLALPEKLAELVATLQEIRDAVILQNRITWTQYQTQMTASGWVPGHGKDYLDPLPSPTVEDPS